VSKVIGDLSNCRVLICNDDGIYAKGLQVMEHIMKTLCGDVWVVAPADEQSGSGHSITLRSPIRYRKLADKRFLVHGTPTDCMLIAIQSLMKESPPDIVLSGINLGANLGEDVHYSGTVAAALEGTLQGIPSIAFSQISNSTSRWQTAEYYFADIVQALCHHEWKDNILLNVNFPDLDYNQVKGIKITSQGKHKIGDDLLLRHDPRGNPYIWVGSMRLGDVSIDGTDIKAIEDGFISITPLHINMTDKKMISSLAKIKW